MKRTTDARILKGDGAFRNKIQIGTGVF